MKGNRPVNSRRSFIKGLVAGSAVFAGLLSASDRNAHADEEHSGDSCPGEVLYRETEAFREYYEMLRNS